MATDIGPDMLRRLDEKLAAGELDAAGHEAKRAEVLELIRRGKAVEYSMGERLARAGVGVFLLVAGVGALAGRVFGAPALFAWAGLVLIGFGAALTWRRLRE